jgi:DNA-binding CsgD family transcriptional regulator
MREAEVSFTDSEYEVMGIEELVSVCQEAGLRELDELECTGNGGLMQVVAEERIDEETLDDLEYVYQWEFVTERDDAYLYIIGFVAPALPDGIAEYADELVGTCDPEIGEYQTTMSLVGPQEAIRDMVREYVDAGVNPTLQSLGEYDGSDRPLAELTDRQREVMETAYEEGFYEVPRAASTEDIAAKLDVDPSTVAEHLQRAERNLLSRHLASG